MKEEGVIEELKDNLAHVRLARKPSCMLCSSSCAKRSGSKTFLWVENAIEAKVGEHVYLVVDDSIFLKWVLTGFGVPTLFFLVGFVFFKNVLRLSDLIAFLIALLLTGLSIFVVAYILKPHGHGFTPRIERIL